MSSSSVASSTMPSVAVSARMARSMDTGSPIWMADAKVVFALTGSKCSQPFLYAWYSGLAFAACRHTHSAPMKQRSMRILIGRHHNHPEQILKVLCGCFFGSFYTLTRPRAGPSAAAPAAAAAAADRRTWHCKRQSAVQAILRTPLWQ